MGDWLWAPLLDSHQAALAAGGLGLLLVFSVLAMWPVRFAGEVSRAERARLGHLDITGALLVWCVRFSPGVLMLGAGLLFFPVAAPVTVFLSSRARPINLDHPNDWDEKWAELVRTHPEPGVDAGPIVDAVCDRLLELPGAQSWRPEDPSLRQYLRETLRTVLAEAEFSRVAPLDVRHRAEVRLPRWLVETVEFAVLKAQAQRANVRSHVVLVADRATETGSAWDSIELYLQSGSSRFRTPEVAISRQPCRSGAQLEQIIDARHQPERGWVIRCVLSVPITTKDTEIRLRLHLGGTKSSEIQMMTLPASAAPGLVIREVVFAEVGADERPTALFQIEPLVSRLIPNHRTGTPVLVRLHVSDADLWLDTWRTLMRDLAFNDWRQRMRDWGHPLDDLKFSTSQGDVVVDGVSAPESLWIYGANRGTQPLPHAVAGKELSSPVRATRTTSGDTPGQFSWDRLPLAGQGATPQFRPRDALASAGRRALVRDLEEGAMTRSGTVGAPLVTHHKTSWGECTHFSLDPAAQDALLPLREPARAAVVWTAILSAIRRNSSGWAMREESESFESPQMVLESMDFQKYRADTLATNLLPLVIGLLIYAALVTRGIAGSAMRQLAKGKH
ncbi:hypothetical protein [Zavarzinella formosa]|uniref:hypothetical protein n=1 Tax=Zavarzinella formosa TaxID=360055 RepID=UPI00031A1509|nr:hypothetical protein [Zavarzinella formosa]